MSGLFLWMNLVLALAFIEYFAIYNAANQITHSAERTA